MRDLAKLCEILQLLIIFRAVCFRVSNRPQYTVDTLFEYTHYPCYSIQLYFHMDLRYKDNKSDIKIINEFLALDTAFTMSERRRKVTRHKRLPVLISGSPPPIILWAP